MRILILGGDGMLGHKLLVSLSPRHTVRVTLRKSLSDYTAYKLFTIENSYDNVDVAQFDRLTALLHEFKPDAVINAVGIVKQRHEAKAAIPSLEINALFPHRLAQLCATIGARVIHFSTDCVFAGTKGNYTEQDKMDAEDLYGQTKFLGELNEPHCFTFRTSIIGLELARKKSLIEWFLAQKGEIKGFAKAIYSGFTTAEMSRIVEYVLTQHPQLSGIWHVASQPINKYELLSQLNKKISRNDITIKPDSDFNCDRSLCGKRFEQVTGYTAPSWDKMLNELAGEICRV